MKIVIIGATSGIGKELALRYAEQGHSVGVTGRRSHLLDNLKEARPENFVTACFDVTGSENLHQLEKLVGDLNGLDLLVYNAGIGLPSDELVPGNEMTVTKTNVLGFVEIVSWAFSYFLEQGQGQIAVTSSVAALRGNRWSPAYSASKAFMSNYAEGLNLQAARLKKNVVVTDLRPGFMKTKPADGPPRFWEASVDEAVSQTLRAIQKRKRTAYITRRWWLAAQLFKLLPFGLYKRTG